MSKQYRMLVVTLNLLIPLAAFLSPMRSLFNWGTISVLLALMALVSLPMMALSAMTQARWKLHANLLGLSVFGAAVVVLTFMRTQAGL